MVQDHTVAAFASELLERERELGTLAEVLASASAGSGTSVLIEGPAGIGKTRLVDAAAGMAEDLGVCVLRARGIRLESGFSFGVALRLLADRVNDEAFAGAASMARPLLAEGGHPPDQLSGDAMFSLLHGLHWVVANLSERQALLLCVDDAQWADLPSLSFLGYMAQRIEGLRVALVVAVRSGEPTEADESLAELRDRVAVLHPASLSDDAVARRIRGSLPGADDGFCHACARASAGNPFYLSELIAAVVADAVEPTSEEAGRVADLSPGSVSRAVLTRLGRLGAPARGLAEAVAVLGDGARLRHAVEVAGQDPAGYVDVADRLVEADVLAPGDPVSFVHPIVSGSVYGDMSPARRAQMHLRAAEILHRDAAAAETVASHLLNSPHSGHAWVREVLSLAGERAIARGAPRGALGYLGRALEETPGPEERGELLARLGLAQAEAGEQAGAATLSEAVSLISSPQRRARALFDLAFVLTHAGRYPEAAAAAERGLEGSGAADPALAARLKALAVISGSWVEVSDPSANALRIEASLAPPRLEESAPGRAVLGNASIALAFSGAPAERLRDLARRALHLGRPDDDAFDLMAFPLASFGTILSGDYDSAERASTQAVEVARRRGSILELGAAIHVRSIARFRAGRVVESLADAEVAVDAGRWGWGATLPMAHAQLVTALLERGEVDRAEAALDLPGGEERWSMNVSYGVFLVARAALWRTRGRAQDALDQLGVAGKLAGLVGARHGALLPWRPPAVELLLAGGEVGEAERLAAQDVEEARAFGSPGPLGAALRSQGLVFCSTGRSARGLELLRSSEETLRSSQARLEHARTLVELGAALRRAGEVREARGVLRAGLDAVHRCGATVLVERALDELRVAGARPRRPAVTGVAALTPAERRVAELAGQGLSNREVAQRLFVTRRTVEMHLTQVYAKLGIDSRSRLAGAMEVLEPVRIEGG